MESGGDGDGDAGAFELSILTVKIPDWNHHILITYGKLQNEIA